MKNKNILTISLLLILTVVTAIISRFGVNLNWLTFVIMGIAAIKFILVAFQFMEMKKANTVWKALILIYLIAIVSTVSLII